MLKIPPKMYVRCMFGVCLAPQHTPLNSLSQSRLSTGGVCVYVCLGFFSQKKLGKSEKHGHLHSFYDFCHKDAI